MGRQVSEDSESRFARYVEGLTSVIGHADRTAPLRDYCVGLLAAEGRKSVAFGLSLRALDRTLTDAEADALCAAIRDRLKARVGAEIRA